MKKIKLERLKTNLVHVSSRLAKKSISFGGQNFFKKQHNLKETAYKNHAEWKAHWDLKRNGSSFWIGSKDETNGNQNASYDILSGTLKLRVPPCLEDKYGKYVSVFLKFDEKQKSYLQDALTAGIAISYRFAEKIDKTRSGNLIKRYDERGNFAGYQTTHFCYASFDAPEPAKIKTSPFMGVIGIDLNEDHLAIVEVDRHGNYKSQYTMPFNMKGRTTEQRGAILGDHIANICDLALKLGKPIVIEKLDFYVKKQNLREKGKGAFYNRMISSFLYADFNKRISSRARKVGVEIIRENPAFTSVIGAYKFRGYSSLSNHHLAALVIARRALGFSERPKIVTDMHRPDRMDELNVGSALEFHNSCKREKKPKHVWSFWRPNTKKIREKMILSDKKNTSIKTRFFVGPCRPSSLFATMEVMFEHKKGGSICRFLQDLEDWSKVSPVPA